MSKWSRENPPPIKQRIIHRGDTGTVEETADMPGQMTDTRVIFDEGQTSLGRLVHNMECWVSSHELKPYPLVFDIGEAMEAYIDNHLDNVNESTSANITRSEVISWLIVDLAYDTQFTVADVMEYWQEINDAAVPDADNLIDELAGDMVSLIAKVRRLSPNYTECPHHYLSGYCRLCGAPDPTDAVPCSSA